MTASRRLFVVLVAVLVVAAPLSIAPLVTDATASSPPGMVTVPDSNIQSDLPKRTPMGQTAAALADAGVLTSDHASTLNVTVTSPGRAKNKYDFAIQGSGPIAIVFEDDTHHDGRRVAVPVDPLKDAVGTVPEMAWGSHDNGTKWTSEVRIVDGYAVVSVPAFSTNVVTWSGQFVADGEYTDGSSFTYEQDADTTASNYEINVTGVNATAWDNESASGLSPTATESVSIGGTADPTGTAAGGDLELSVTGHAKPYTTNPFEDQGDGNGDGLNLHIWGDDGNGNGAKSEVSFKPTASGDITNITVNMAYADKYYDGEVDIYVVTGESADGVYSEGTLVKSGYTPTSSTSQTIQFDTTVSVTAGQVATIEFVSTDDGDASHDTHKVQGDDSGSDAWWSDDGGTSQYYASVNVAIEAAPDGVAVDPNTESQSSLGDFTDGETKTVTIDADKSLDTLDFSGTYGTLSYSLPVEELTETVDPSIEVNGQWTNHTGSLKDGETVTLTTDTAWVQDGTNRVNVSVTPSVTSDAPTPTVDLYYTHDGEDNSTVSYTANRWTEEYNISKTYATSQTNASVTIPFAATSVQIKTLEYRVNGGSWQTPSYDLDNTTLTAYVGALSADDTVTVRTTAHKIVAHNASVTVTNPTLLNQPLDTKLDVDSWTDDSYLAVGDTANATRLHYVYDATYVTGEYQIIQADGTHRLYMPNAAGGESVRVADIPVTVSPETGDVRVSVPDPRSTEPVFVVAPGDTVGDRVTFTFEAAADRETYQLRSATSGVVYDEGTAGSPVSLTDNDDSETLVFRLVDSSSSSGGTVGGGGGGVFAAASGLLSGPVIAVVLGGLLVVLVAYGVARVRGGGATGGRGAGGRGTGAGGGVAGVLERAAAAVRAAVARLLRWLVGSRVGRVVGVVGTLAVTLWSGVLTVPSGTGIVLAVPALLVGVFLVLRRTDSWSLPVFLVLTVTAGVLALSTLGTDVIGTVVGSDAFPILGIGGLFILYQVIQAWRAGQSDSATIVVEGSQGGE